MKKSHCPISKFKYALLIATAILFFKNKKLIVHSKDLNKKKQKMFDFKKRHMEEEKDITLMESNKGLLK